MFTPRQVAKTFVATEQSEGVGARVYRSVGSVQLPKLDPFLVLDEAFYGLPGGFPDHPHRGFETVSYVLPSSKGKSHHEDFLGTEGELGPGDLQWMTAGRGIVHSEMPKNGDRVHGLQLWVNLPKQRKMVEPRYQEVPSESVPHAFNEDKSVEALVFAGEVFGQRGPIETEATVTYVHFILNSGAKLEYPVSSTHNALVYAIGGKGRCLDNTIEPHQAIVMELGGDGVLLTAADNDKLEVIVMTGEPLNEPVVQDGLFVMSSNEEIRQTFEDFRLAQNGFENARTWKSKHGFKRDFQMP
ncbi:hypothetical protein F442_08268 [Phytophthora nicotianae P10297]|uniref:Pirin-like protein n=5 Tax=Phytophthora nicotianae TaxID=4792 RepID=W2PCV7_PHYN3|nr:hypothetical protein PPTG_20023 [Phytophthora nicotianae INRA-310]ETI44983.1 hypothetical protein F443_10358 [Phytophthora nicotianae P1569]ETM48725.1 hypothetical protein L914_06788 [Phytophthora nicotianae]ETO73602.1 hypothetical protein F444_10468 [Phytophthora nicotianae P1976]ETP45310.1 hypothetical protein F442_08268 [Phytophthora nicotianae P10297]KUF86863.1 hypothetical protein AM588_10001307 [Phytophthora nicotianae]